MRRWLRLMAVMVVATVLGARPALAQGTPAPMPAAAICHECSWIRAQIDDIDEKIAGWERQIKSLHKYADLKDPGIQNALKDIDKDIAGLKAKKAQLLIKLAECEKRCAAAKAAEPPKPATPGASISGAGAASFTTPGPKPKPKTGGPDSGGGALTTPRGPPPTTAPRVCVIDGRMAWAPNGNDRFILPPRRYKKWPDWPPWPPEGTLAYDDWRHVMNHLDDFDEDWDVDDIWDITADLNDVIDDAQEALEDNPFNEAAFDRLLWAQDELDYFRAAKAWYRIRFGKPYWEGCPPPGSVAPLPGRASLGLDPLALGVVDQINRVRVDPRGYGDGLRDVGPGADETRRFLHGLDPRAIVVVDPRLVDAAQAMVRELGQTGGTSHIGEGGLTIGQRLKKRGLFAGLSAEEISFGQTTPAGVVNQWLIDNGVPTHFHRLDIVDGKLVFIGVACGPHPKFGHVCVADLAGAMMPPPPPPP